MRDTLLLLVTKPHSAQCVSPPKLNSYHLPLAVSTTMSFPLPMTLILIQIFLIIKDQCHLKYLEPDFVALCRIARRRGLQSHCRRRLFHSTSHPISSKLQSIIPPSSITHIYIWTVYRPLSSNKRTVQKTSRKIKQRFPRVCVFLC